MPRLRMDDDEFNVDELDEAEYDEESQYDPYTGPTPPDNTVLTGHFKKAWWTFTKNDDRMMKTIFEADEFAGKYKGCPVWDNITFNAQSKWRWKPFLDATGLTLVDVKKKMFVVGDEDDPNLGAPIQKIGTWVPGEESSAVRAIVASKRGTDGVMRLNVVKYLPYEDDDYEDDEDEEEPEEEPVRPTRARAAKSAATSKAGAAKRRAAPEPVEDDEEDAEEEEDQEEEAAPEPRRTRRAAKPDAAPGRKPARAATPVPARRTAASGKVAGKPTRTRRASSQGSDEEPPF